MTMKKLIPLWIITLVLVNISLASAEVGGTVTRSMPSLSFSSPEAFLEAEWKFCNTATDGINIIMIENGEFTISTMAYTPNPEYSCTNYKLSENDMSLYYHASDVVGDEYSKKVSNAVRSYEERMKMLRWSDERRKQAHEETIQQAEEMIFTLLSKYPQDIALPTQANLLYMKLTLIKFELELLDM